MVKHERDWPFSPNESHTLLGLLCGVDQEGQAVKGVGHDVELYKVGLYQFHRVDGVPKTSGRSVCRRCFPPYRTRCDYTQSDMPVLQVQIHIVHVLAQQQDISVATHSLSGPQGERVRLQKLSV